MKSKLILIIILLHSFINLQAQNKTPYEKKVESLTRIFFKDIGLRPAFIDDAIKSGSNSNIWMLKEVRYAMSSFAYSDYGKLRIIQLQQDLNEAEKLKTGKDIEKDKFEKEKIDTEESERKYLKSDEVKIKNSINEIFKKWNQKGEFEKEIDYEERLKNKSKESFSKICIVQIKNEIKNNKYGFSEHDGNRDYWKKELSFYNSEKELFTVKFELNGVEWQNDITISIAKAEGFKENWKDLKFEIDDYNWSFVDNNLCPNLVILKNIDTKYKFPLSLKNKLDISYSFNDFEINNPYLKDYVFSYSSAKILDSLELSTYNQKLDSIFNDFNRQLLKNPYNLKQVVMTDYKKVDGENDRENNFDNNMSSIKSKYEQLNNYFLQKFENEFAVSQNLFLTKDEFYSFYSKGGDVYLTEKEKREVLYELEVNKIFVELMDFRNEGKGSAGSSLVRALLDSPNRDKSARDPMLERNQFILLSINKTKNKPSYSIVLDFVFEINKNLNKEWSKNGQFFENKEHFYDAYISNEYKEILKENKKTKFL